MPQDDDSNTPSRFRNLAAAAGAESADADEPEATFPRLLRYALASSHSTNQLRDRLLGDIVALAPDMEDLATRWTDKPAKTAAALAKALDAGAVEGDRPALRTLADCVRILGIPSGPENHADHCRVAAALAACADKTTVSIEMGARIQAVVTGWAMVAAGTIIFDGALAFDVAQSEAYNRLRPIRQWELQRERDALAAEVRESEEHAKAEVDEKHDAEDQKSVETPDGFVRICNLSPDAAKDKKLKEVIAGHEHLIGTDVALAGTPDIAVIRRQLAFEFPYAISAIDQVLQDLVGRVAVRLRPTLFVGQPGGGKSRFARRLADLLGAGVWRVDASQGDGAVIGGTARRWYSAEPSHPFLAISRARFANPLLIVDELEKAGTRSDYGRLWDAMLGLLEPETSRCYPDPALQTPLDLSHVSYIATANSADPLPAPLRDRLRIIDFPLPSLEDIDALFPPVIYDLARERGVDARWVPPLTGGERELVSTYWTGGSVRALKRLVEVVLTERERHEQRH